MGVIVKGGKFNKDQCPRNKVKQVEMKIDLFESYEQPNAGRVHCFATTTHAAWLSNLVTRLGIVDFIARPFEDFVIIVL